ncbi:MAG: DegV family protein [Clostridia bacterium]
MNVLFIDTDGELWFNKADEVTANIIRMPYTINGEEFYDDCGRGADYTSFFQKLRQGGNATTSALNSVDYINYFEPFFAKGDDIFYISFGSKMSATFDHLDNAIKELFVKYPDRHFTRFDTANISMGAGFMQYYGGKKFNECKNIEETVAYLTTLRNQVCTIFVVDDLNHLKKGGRISATTAVFGTLLGIKPVLKITDKGVIENVDKIKGAKRVITYLANEVKTHITETDKYDIWIMEADCLDEATQLQQAINELLPNTTVHIQMVGPVIGAHCGPGTIGLIFHADHR